MLVLDKSRALDEMLWLSQRTRNAVPMPYQRPPALAAITTPDGTRRLAAPLVLREPEPAPAAQSLVMTATLAPQP